jgi:hypothetical protein
MRKYEMRTVFCVIAAMVLVGMLLQASAQEKAKTESTPKKMNGWTIARLVVGTGVENLEPTGLAETFPSSTEKVYCFLEATDITQDTEVSFVWFHGQNELLKFNLPLIKGSKWRTFAFKNLYGQKGDWRVEIRDVEGKSLKEVKFKVE